MNMKVKPPWDRDWLQLTPSQFERMVVDYLRGLNAGLRSFAVRHQASISGPDGQFNMDAIATFEALGAEFVVLVECKHHRNPIKRELVQVLSDKVRSVSAQKALFFSTACFQKGAIEYALSQKIALIHFTKGGPIYETKALYAPVGPEQEYDAYFIGLTESGGISYRFGAQDEVARCLFQ